MSWLSPQLVSSLVQLGPGLFQRKTGKDQAKEAEEMQRALGPRVAYGIPEEAKKALGISEDLARPREMAGQTQMQYMMDLENAKSFGRASRAATSSQDLLGVATQLGESGQEGQLKLGMAAAQDYNRRQQDLARALGTMATYQDKVTADRQLDWNQRAAAAAAMKEASMKNRMGAMQGLTQAAVQFLGSDAAKNLFSSFGAPEGQTTNRQTNKKVDNMNALSSDGEEGIIDPTGYTPPGMTDKQMLEVTGMNNTGGFNYSTPTPPQLFPQSSTPFLNMGQQIGQQMYGNAFPTNSGIQFQQNPTYTGQSVFNNPSSGAIFPQQQMPMYGGPGIMPFTKPSDLFNLFNSYQRM